MKQATITIRVTLDNPRAAPLERLQDAVRYGMTVGAVRDSMGASLARHGANVLSVDVDGVPPVFTGQAADLPRPLRVPICQRDHSADRPGATKCCHLHPGQAHELDTLG